MERSMKMVFHTEEALVDAVVPAVVSGEEEGACGYKIISGEGDGAEEKTDGDGDIPAPAE